MNKVWVEVFKTGTHTASNGVKKTYTDEHLDQMVGAFAALKEKVKVPLRVGSHGVLAPAGGWVSNLKREGVKLMAEFADVPEIVRKAINRRIYKTVSSGLWFDWKDDEEKVYPVVLNHVALLGGRLPAVKGLEDIQAMFDAEDQGGIARLDFENEEYLDMNELDIAKRDIERLEGELKVERDGRVTDAAAFEDKLAAENKTREDRISTLETEKAEHEATAAKAEVEAVVEAAFKEGKLLPKNRDKALSVGMALRKTADFAEDDSPYANWCDSFKSSPKVVDFDEKGEVVVPEDSGEPADTRTKAEREFEAEMAEGATYGLPKDTK